MLTIQVNDSRLEAQLAQRAAVTGQSAEQIAQELLMEALGTHLIFTKLDPTQHSQLLRFDIDPVTDDAPAFQHVSDTTGYADELRRNAWKR